MAEFIKFGESDILRGFEFANLKGQWPSQKDPITVTAFDWSKPGVTADKKCDCISDWITLQTVLAMKHGFLTSPALTDRAQL